MNEGLASPWLALAATTLVSFPAAQTVRLNGPLAQPGAGDVLEYEISPSGTHVAYRADQVQDNVFELFAAPLDGSAAPVRLHAPLTGPNKNVTAFGIGAGELVVYVADLAINEQFELYSAPLAGSASPLLLSVGMVAGGDVSSFRLTPDGTRAVFLADWLVNDRPELFVVPIDGSAAPLRLDAFDRRATSLYRIGTDGTFVVYATAATFGTHELLHRVPLDASQPPLFLADSGSPSLELTYFTELELAADDLHGAFVRIDGYATPGEEDYASVHGVTLDGSAPSAELQIDPVYLGLQPRPSFAPSGNRVVYIESNGVFTTDGDLYTIEVNGSGRVLLGQEVSEFTLSPDGTLVAFLSGTPATSTLFLAPADGSSPASPLTAPGQLASPRFSLDAELVLFLATDPMSFRGLFAVTTGGSPPLLLNAPAVPERGVADFAFAPDGQAVVYREERAGDELYELWSVDASLTPRKLSGALGGFRDVLSFRFSPDGQRVVYLADQNVDQTDELFGVPVDGATPPLKYNDPLPEGPVLGDVVEFRPTSNGSHVLYRADQKTDGFIDLYATRTDGRDPAVRLTAPVAVGGFVDDFVVTPSGAKVVFELAHRLCTSPRSGAGPAVELDVSPFGYPAPILVDPGESFAVFRRLLRSTGGYSLHRVDLDGSQPAITLAHPPPGNEAVLLYDITPDGLGVLFTANLNDASEVELFRVPSDGSGPTVRLNLPLPTGGDVTSFRISPSSGRVVYRAPQDFGGRVELYSTPSDGSGPVVKLNGTPVSEGDVEEYVLTPDDTRVVYRADQVVNDQLELFVAPLVGGTPALRLTVLPAGRDVEPDFALGADSAAVFYRADALTAGVLELFTVPTDASASPLRLSADLVAGGDVSSFAVSPDQAWVVYLADQNADQLFELFSVPVSGGPAAVLNSPLPANSDVTHFRIDPESQWVYWLGDALGVQRFELFRSPIDGSAPPERLHPDLTPAGDVQPDFVPLTGGRVLFRADLENDGVFELYSFLGNGKRLRSGAPRDP